MSDLARQLCKRGHRLTPANTSWRLWHGFRCRQCRTCERENAKKWWHKHPERARAKNRRRDWRKTGDALLRHRANQKVYVAIAKGQLIRPSSCSGCGKACVPEGHHPDYSKPLEVIWLCIECHSLTRRGSAIRP